jgi:carboxypeptidase family protein
MVPNKVEYMTQKEKSLDRLYVSTPCKADWEIMPGNEQVRFCSQCGLNVYNISALTRKQAEKLIAETEGRLCAKLYRRADGTVITRDCPIGIRAFKRRASRVANAALSAILGIFTNHIVAMAKDGHENCRHYTARIVRSETEQSAALIMGTVFSEIKEGIPDSKVTIINEETGRKYTSNTDGKGEYRISSLPAGSYSIIVESRGFSVFRKKAVKINEGEGLQFDVILQVGSTGGVAFLPKGPEGGKSNRAMREIC